MYPIQSNINTQSADFTANKQAYQPLLEQWRQRMTEVTHPAANKAIEKHKQRGKLLARERVNQLLDANTPFLSYRRSLLTAFMIINFPPPAS
ncbi:hypothetical protein LWM68_29815 [Niabella sp. W65]|nr:hypothetical protein [Niabella sp. W65]MCH7366592.1 hypothetical protein [Niabella sp. W65]